MIGSAGRVKGSWRGFVRGRVSRPRLPQWPSDGVQAPDSTVTKRLERSARHRAADPS